MEAVRMDIIQSMLDKVGISSVSRRINSPTQEKSENEAEIPVPSHNDDQADTSTLSRLMSKSAGDLAEEMSSRPEVVARFANAKDNVDLSDSAIATILRRMAG